MLDEDATAPTKKTRRKHYKKKMRVNSYGVCIYGARFRLFAVSEVLWTNWTRIQMASKTRAKRTSSKAKMSVCGVCVWGCVCWGEWGLGARISKRSWRWHLKSFQNSAIPGQSGPPQIDQEKPQYLQKRKRSSFRSNLRSFHYRAQLEESIHWGWAVTADGSWITGAAWTRNAGNFDTGAQSTGSQLLQLEIKQTDPPALECFEVLKKKEITGSSVPFIGSLQPGESASIRLVWTGGRVEGGFVDKKGHFFLARCAREKGHLKPNMQFCVDFWYSSTIMSPEDVF
jgi:hypothetical protein